MRSLARLLREHMWGVALLVVLLIGSSIAVRAWKAKHPGAMSVLESQAMDMTVMKPPVGSVPVATEVVHLGQFTAKVTYTGSVAPLQEQVIYPRVEGWLKDFRIYDGDSVSQGQLLAVVDSPDLQTRVAEASAGRVAAASEVPTAKFNAARMQAEKAAAQGDVQTAKTELPRAKAMVAAAEKAVVQRRKDVKSAQADLDYWKAEIKREANLLEAGAVSQQEYDAENARFISAQAELENRQAALDAAQANVEAARAEVAGKQSMIGVASQRVAAADAALSAAYSEVSAKSAKAQQAGAAVATAATVDAYRYVKAPFAGKITRRYVSPGQFVTPSTAITNVVQIDKVRLQANVSDQDVDKITVGALVTARFTKDKNMVIDAVVTSVSPVADQTSRTAVVEAVVANPGYKLIPGDAVTMEIAVSGQAGSISVPVGAIVQKDGMNAVWVARSEARKGKTIYYCTMHPEVTSDKPGECYKCNMKLVPKTSDGNKKAHLVMVTTGPSGGDRVQVMRGLSDGDEVIYQGNTYLKEGDTVFPTRWTADGPEKMPNAPGMDDMPDMPGMDHSSAPTGSAPVASEPTRHDMSGMDKSKPQETSPNLKVKKGEKVYVCPMHPHEMSHDPNARCRLCGMTLELKK